MFRPGSQNLRARRLEATEHMQNAYDLILHFTECLRKKIQKKLQNSKKRNSHENNNIFFPYFEMLSLYRHSIKKIYLYMCILSNEIEKIIKKLFHIF